MAPRSGDQGEPRRLRHRKPDRPHARDALDAGGQLGVDDEVAAEHQVRFPTIERGAEQELAVAAALAGGDRGEGADRVLMLDLNLDLEAGSLRQALERLERTDGDSRRLL